jgi:nitroimidazol reductase NimA-like FMN-containing flavoprotein (pyridoxamine 5'-phosphate oxidase superfamily)
MEVYMRRRDREVSDYNEIFEIIKKCDVCRIAFFDEKYPYIIPMNFGAVLKENTFRLFFHSATAGTKLELLKKNPFVAFEMDCSHRLLLGEKACDSTMEYESVIGSGLIEVVDGDAKYDAMSLIMAQYHKEGMEFNKEILNFVTMYQLTVNNITGKAHIMNK